MNPSARRIALASGLNYHVLEWDAPHDHTVILIHGFLDLAWSWEPVVSEGLAARYHIVAPDMRGHGDSDRVGIGGYYHFADYVADLDDLMTQLGRDQVSLVGHSMGGAIASYFAGTFPDRVRRLVLLEGTGPTLGLPTGPERMKNWLEDLRRVYQQPSPRGYASIQEAADRLCAHDPLLSRELAVKLASWGTSRHENGRFHFKHDPLHLTRGPYGFTVEVAERFWQKIPCPTLLVDGASSSFSSPDENTRRAALFPQGRRVILAGAGHMMMRHRPRELAELIDQFLSE